MTDDAMEILHYQTSDGHIPFREWLDTGAGYRVYYARTGKKVVLLLCGSDKRKQTADIKRGKEYWRDYEQRTRRRSRSR